MTRKLILGLAAGVGLAVVGCETASSQKPATPPADQGAARGQPGMEAARKVGETVKDAAKDTAEAAKEAAKDAKAWTKDEVLKPIEAELPKVRTKIDGLAGDAKTGAQTAFEAFKKQLDEFRAAPADKLREQGEKLVEAFAKLKVRVGL